MYRLDKVSHIDRRRFESYIHVASTGPGTLYVIDIKPQGLLLNKRQEYNMFLID